jgi:predicted nucleic acid-binding protein
MPSLGPNARPGSPPGEALTLWTEVMTTTPALFPSVPLMPRAISISSSVRMGSYDCLYIALAEKENCELVTADDKLVKNLQSQFPFIQHISTFP